MVKMKIKFFSQVSIGKSVAICNSEIFIVTEIFAGCNGNPCTRHRVFTGIGEGYLPIQVVTRLKCAAPCSTMSLESLRLESLTAGRSETARANTFFCALLETVCHRHC